MVDTRLDSQPVPVWHEKTALERRKKRIEQLGIGPGTSVRYKNPLYNTIIYEVLSVTSQYMLLVKKKMRKPWYTFKFQVSPLSIELAQ